MVTKQKRKLTTDEHVVLEISLMVDFLLSNYTAVVVSLGHRNKGFNVVMLHFR